MRSKSKQKTAAVEKLNRLENSDEALLRPYQGLRHFSEAV